MLQLLSELAAICRRGHRADFNLVPMEGFAHIEVTFFILCLELFGQRHVSTTMVLLYRWTQ